MALSKFALGSAMLLVKGALGAYIQVPILDSNEKPNDGFKDGLPTYVKVSRDNDLENKIEQYLLCTSCTISYVFDTVPNFANTVTTETMNFKGDSQDTATSDVTVDFIQQDLYLCADEQCEETYTWNMNIGYISPTYRTPQYFDTVEENMLGLAAMKLDTEGDLTSDLAKRQFLLQFINSSDAKIKDLGLVESYAFNGGNEFTIGGTEADYNTLVCADGADEGEGFVNNPVVLQDALPTANGTLVFSPVQYYKSTDLMLKIQNYVPPMKQELNQQVLTVDTWQRETQLPSFFYDYFMDTFMIPAYTCDELEAKDLAYPGMESTYSCYCNNGDYHTMPQINLEISGKNLQFDFDPADYMFLPYLNYTVPMSLCLLGVQSTPGVLPNGLDYVSLGQRAMAKFPFFQIYDRVANTATVELGGATALGGKSALGIQIAISITVVVILFIMLIYLIVLRRNRIKAEEWLEQHKSTIFSQAANLKTEEEILEALVKSKELKDLLENRNPPSTPNARRTSGMAQDMSTRLVSNDAASENDSQNTSQTGKKMPAKVFKEESH